MVDPCVQQFNHHSQERQLALQRRQDAVELERDIELDAEIAGEADEYPGSAEDTPPTPPRGTSSTSPAGSAT
jgi:hypothetical protein